MSAALTSPTESTANESIGLVVLIASGVLSILLEILSIMYANQFTAHSMYSVAAVLFAFIVNFGIASWLASALTRRGIRSVTLLAWTMAAAGFFCAIYPALIQRVLQSGLPTYSPYSVVSIAGLAALMTLLLAPLHLAAGMVFPLAWNLLKRSSGRQGEAFGHVVSWNKLGSAVGAFAGPFVLFPWIGFPGTMIMAGVLYLALSLLTALFLLEPCTARRSILSSATTAVAVAAILFTLRQVPVEIHESRHVIASYQGADGIVAVTENSKGSRHIVVNNSYVLNGTERALLSQKQESWLPLALCKAPQRVAFIGMASGISAAAALDFPIARLESVELIPEVVRAAREHFAAWNERLFSDPRAHIRINDGRYVIQSSPTPYDLVICDLMFKEHEGTSSLYSKEFFAAIRTKLSTNGKFCLWLPLYQLDAELSGIILHTFLDVFPNAIAIRGNLDPLQPTMALVGSNEAIDLSSEFLSSQLENGAIQKLRNECPFFRSVSNLRLILLGDLRAASAGFSQFPTNTDDRPVFAFKGPRSIPGTESLLGLTFLKWFGTRFMLADYPSCYLGNTPPRELLAGIRAGNHFFAASVSALNLPVELSQGHEIERARQTIEHLQTACKLSPKSDLKQTELCQ